MTEGSHQAALRTHTPRGAEQDGGGVCENWGRRNKARGKKHEEEQKEGFLPQTKKKKGGGVVVFCVRPLPCEGRGREWDSRRPRHIFNDLRRPPKFSVPIRL